MSKFIRTFLIGIAVLGMGAEVHAQDDVDCIKCVDTSDIAGGAVNASKIRKKAVTAVKLAPQAVTTGKLAPQSVTTAKIKDGAITLNKVSPKLSNAIGTSCSAGESVVGMDANGRFICESKLVQSLNADLTGKTYCLFGQGYYLTAEAGVSASVEFEPYSSRLDFTSPTELTITGIYGPYSRVGFPSYTMVDGVDDSGGSVMGTYTVVGNQLTITEDDNGDIEMNSYTMTPDGQVFVTGSFERSVFGGVDIWETTIEVGVRADSCD